MRRLFSLGSAVVLLLAGSEGRAADPPAPTSLSGTIVSATASSLVVRGSAGVEHAFVVDAKTTLPESLSAGTKVTVEYKPLADGRKQATRVIVMTASSTNDPPAGGLPGTTNPLLPVGLAGLVALGGGVVLRQAFHEEHVGQLK